MPSEGRRPSIYTGPNPCRLRPETLPTLTSGMPCDRAHQVTSSGCHNSLFRACATKTVQCLSYTVVFLLQPHVVLGWTRYRSHPNSKPLVFREIQGRLNYTENSSTRPNQTNDSKIPQKQTSSSRRISIKNGQGLRKLLCSGVSELIPCSTDHYPTLRLR
jgi:hypothetical protein